MQDVAQEAFIKAYRALPKFRGDSAFYTWLYRIAINTAKNHLVARGRRPPSSDVDVDETELYDGQSVLRSIESPESMLYGEEIRSGVEEAIPRGAEDSSSDSTLR